MSGGNAMGGSTGGGLGQAAGDLLKEMQKAQNEVQTLESKRSGGSSDAFSQMLQSGNAQPSQAATAVDPSKMGQGNNVVDVLRQAKAEHANPSTRVGATEHAEESKLQGMVSQLVHGQDKMTKIMNLALSGKQFSPTDLLSMQVAVYRYSQELDLTSKVVQQATSGIKQTLNTQV